MATAVFTWLEPWESMWLQCHYFKHRWGCKAQRCQRIIRKAAKPAPR